MSEISEFGISRYNRESWPDQQIKRLLILLVEEDCNSVLELMEEYDMQEWYFSWYPPASWRERK